MYNPSFLSLTVYAFALFVSFKFVRANTPISDTVVQDDLENYNGITLALASRPYVPLRAVTPLRTLAYLLAESGTLGNPCVGTLAILALRFLAEYSKAPSRITGRMRRRDVRIPARLGIRIHFRRTIPGLSVQKMRFGSCTTCTLQRMDGEMSLLQRDTGMTGRGYVL